MNNPPTAVTGSSLNSNESGTSISDANGNLLFYTDGVTVWNQNDIVMGNGTGLAGNNSSTQGALIIPQFGGPVYYIFTTGVNGSLCYSLVDMTLASGMGSVTVKNVTLTNNCSEKLTAMRHCNGVDYWVVAHEKTTNNFLSYLVGASMFVGLPVVSSIGSSYNSALSGAGVLQFSPTGRKLVAALTDLNLIEMFDFNPAGGVVTNSFTLNSSLILPYGLEFSPDGTKLYGATFAGIPIYQWDMCAGSDSAVAASQQTVCNSGNAKYQMTLAPNGQIYVARNAQSVIGSITNPNALGPGCGFVELAQSVLPGLSRPHMPNLVKFNTVPAPTPTFVWTQTNSPVCYNANFIAQPYGSSCPAVFTYSVLYYQWDFGDPASLSNYAWQPITSHIYSGPGTYTAQLIMIKSCGGTDTVTQVITINQPCFTVASSSITCANLGTATITANSGIGPFSYTWTPGLQTGSVAVNLAPGSYTVLAYDSAASLLSSYSVTFTPPVLLSGTAITTSVSCYAVPSASASVINISGGSGNQYYSWTNGLITYTAANPSTLGAGSWSVLVTDALTGCTIDSSFVISSLPPISTTLSASVPSVCAGGSLVLNALVSGGVPALSYTWSSGPANADYTVTLPVSGTYVYSLAVSDASNCQVTETISVLSVPYPILSVNNPSSCPAESITLTAIGAASYSWNGVPGTNTLTDNPTVTTQYTLNGVTAGCGYSLTAQIFVKPIPMFTLSANGPLCAGESFTANVNAGNLFSWQGPQAFSSSAASFTINPVSVNSGGVYDVTVTAVNNCTATGATTLTVYALPTLAVSGNTVCAGQSLSLTSASSATSILWLGPQSFSSSVQNPVLSNATLTMTGTYSVTATSIDNCSFTANAQAMVVAPPNLSVSLSSQSMCAQALSGSPNTITLTSSGATTYTLSTPAHIANPNPSGPSSPVNLVPPYQPTGPATATLFGSNGVCTVSITSIFTVVPNPTLSVINPTPVICAGDSYTYTSSGASSYTWSAASPGNTLYTTGTAVVASTTINSVFSVVGGSLGCLSAAQSSSISINPLPTLTLNPTTATVCKNSGVLLTANGTGTLITWAPAMWLNTTSGASVISTPLSNLTYSVVNSLNSCTATAQIPVSLLPLPTAVITATNTSMCADGKINLLGSGGQGYSWSGPYGVISTQQDLIVNGAVSSTGLYTLTVNDQNGCKGTATQAITVHPLPTGGFFNNLADCVPFEFYPGFKVNTSSAPAVSTSWSYGAITYTATSPLIRITAAGNYPLFATVSDVNGCARTFSTLITAYPKPEAFFTYSPDKIIEGFDLVSFQDASSQAVSYHWYFGDHQQGSTLKNPSYLFENVGVYPVALVVKSQWQCVDTIVRLIEVKADDAIYVPSAFTPNEDGKNDVFGPVFKNTRAVTLIIMDRWGERIFEKSGADAKWDGTFKGQPCKEDVYVWMLEVIDAPGGSARKLSGHVTLYR